VHNFNLNGGLTNAERIMKAFGPVVVMVVGLCIWIFDRVRGGSALCSRLADLPTASAR
jgi:hypothetical protein